MGKGDGFLTAKAIGNRIKAKGLQKLRWFCQVCEKQCRDENGFKCHTTSESHQRQMLIVANNPDKFLSEYSNEFETTFLESLRRRHGTKRMAINVVYNEYIADKLHIHMNATQWTTLGNFVQYLGRTGKCVVDETEKGWFVQYIDRDPRTLARQEEMDKKKKAELDHEERNRLFIDRQLKIAQEARNTGDNDDGESDRPTKMMRRGDGEEIKISMSLATTTKEKTKDPQQKQQQQPLAMRNVFVQEQDERDTGASIRSSSTRAIDALTQEFQQRSSRDQQQQQQQQQQHTHKRRRQDEQQEEEKQENWVTTGIIVKVMNKKVGQGKYYKSKGEIVRVQDPFTATVEMIDSGDVLQLDQDDLETVIPKVGKRVKIVNGPGRGHVAKLLEISVDDFCASVRIETGSRRGDVLDRVEYEAICRLADDRSSDKR